MDGSSAINIISDKRQGGHLEAKGHRETRRSALRQTLKVQREEMLTGTKNGKDAVDAVAVLPEEMWTLILDYMTAAKDLESCAKTCALFDKVLNGSKTRWLFGKIFPFVIRDLDTAQVLNCRRVCKLWTTGVDLVLEHCRLPEPEIPVPDCLENSTSMEYQPRFGGPIILLPKLKICYKFCFPPPLNPSLQFYYDIREVREEMASHPRNPFLGKSVSVWSHCTPMTGYPLFNSPLKQFLTKFGTNIINFTFSQDGWYELFSDFWKGVLFSLEGCPNLRTLSLQGTFFGEGYLTPKTVIPDHSKLECLFIHLKANYADSLRGFTDKLIEKYSNQLKKLTVDKPIKRGFHSLRWGELRELRVTEEMGDEKEISSLGEMCAPKLQRLEVRIDQNISKSLEFIPLFKNFPNLQHFGLD